MAVDFPPRKRKAPMAQMNVVPYIDVMLVLLIIFMVTAPMLSMGEIQIPSAGAASKAPEQYIRLSISLTEQLEITDLAGNTTPATTEQLITNIKTIQGENENIPVIIAADEKLEYEKVIKILDVLQKNGIKKVSLLVTGKN